MRIVVDLQGAQTESRYRGIGRYSMALASALVRNAGDHEIWIVLNAALRPGAAAVRHALEGAIPKQRIRVFDAPCPLAAANPSNAWRARVAEKIREYFIDQLRPDMVLVTSLFEGFVDDGVASVGEFTGGKATAVILYDLIPLLNPSSYLATAVQREYYDRKIGSLRKAGLLLSISDYSRVEAIQTLGLAPEHVVSISTAADACFRPDGSTPADTAALLSRLGIRRKMVMTSPGGLDARKNVDALIAAYGLLPGTLRAEHQLVVVSRLSDSQRDQLRHLARQAGLAPDELVLAGYVADEDLATLYRAAALFVLPSRHEGFGLPALEAMACGAPVIGSRCTSIPEVIGREDALFDPSSPRAIADKLQELLGSEHLRDELRAHGLAQAGRFSWDETARRALRALERHHAESLAAITKARPLAAGRPKPKLAYISPLPPERTGIANYSSELLPVLMEHFDIELVSDQASFSLTGGTETLPRRSVAWFEANAGAFDRVLYHFGNSPFHSHMFELLQRHPGVVVMHDFFLSSVLAYGETSGSMPGAWTRALHHSHGYMAVQERLAPGGEQRAKERYPVNLDILQAARGIIVHSEHSRRLAREWYGAEAADEWHTIPHLRSPAATVDRAGARKALGIADHVFLVCSFGFVDPTKLSHRLVDAFLSSALGRDPDCMLVLVGAEHRGPYGERLNHEIAKGGGRIRITGWADGPVYRDYLQAANLAVQLRTNSRGETSGAVLDCMNHGLPLIVNASGSMADLPDREVCKLPEEFEDVELISVLEDLCRDERKRMELGEAARALIRRVHDPVSCAARYAQAIESVYERASVDSDSLIKAIASSAELPAGDRELAHVAQVIANSSIPPLERKQLLVDVSVISRNDLQTGIERVVRAQLLELLRQPPEGFRVEPVQLCCDDGPPHYRYARVYVARLLGYTTDALEESKIDIAPGDIYYGADFCPSDVLKASAAGVYADWKVRGVEVAFLVYDLLPILRPEFFPPGADAAHTDWLACVAASADRLICISHSVANDVRHWLARTGQPKHAGLEVDAVHLGADFRATAPSMGLAPEADRVLARLSSKPTFLLVGTIEPRKGHLQALAAFEQLWREGYEVNLAIVGKEGWTHLQDSQRRTIPRIVDALRNHREREQRLFWFPGISDEYLDKIYEACACLLAPSEGEGFGLPLIEAASHGRPVIARDLPVFREIGSEGVRYFSGLDADALAGAVRTWLEAAGRDRGAAASRAVEWRTWADSAREVSAMLTRVASAVS